MRFKQFITEATVKQPTKQPNFEKMMNLISVRCKPFLNAAKGHLLYRGMMKERWVKGELQHLDLSKLKQFEHPTGRKPRNSETPFNFMFNAGCEMAFGVENIREQSIFGSGNYFQAMVYGEVLLVFPIGKIKYISSRKIVDSIETRKFLIDLTNRLEQPAKSGLMDAFGALAIKMTPHEWVLNPRQESGSNDAEFNYRLAHELRKIYDEYYDTSGLDKMLAKKNEILFYESDGYFALPISVVLTEMKNKGVPVSDTDTNMEEMSIFIKTYLNDK